MYVLCTLFYVISSMVLSGVIFGLNEGLTIFGFVKYLNVYSRESHVLVLSDTVYVYINTKFYFDD